MTRLIPAIVFLSMTAGLSAQTNVPGGSSGLNPDSAKTVRKRMVSLSRSVMDKDSLTLFEYRHLGEAVGLHPGASMGTLGIEGQPAWISLHGSLPGQFALVEDEINRSDPLTGSTAWLLTGSEDVDRITVYPASEGFWHSGNGLAATAELHRQTWNSTRPFTRLRHTEAPYEYLATDVIFNVSPSPDGVLHIGINRQTNGTSESANPARYTNTRFESWLTRLEYTQRISTHARVQLRHEYADALVFLNGGIAGDRSLSDTAVMTFPSRAGAGFEETAFNPILAPLANPTMVSWTRQHLMLAGGSLDWGSDSLHVSSLRLVYRSSTRHFSDRLSADASSRFAGDDVTSDDSWRIAEARVAHSSELRPLTFEFDARAGWLSTDYRFLNGFEDVLLASAGALASLQAGVVQTRAFGRVDHQAGITSAGIGGGVDVPISSGFGIWAGASVSSRPQTLFERGYRSSRVLVAGGIPDRQDRTVIAEAGLHQHGAWTSNALSVTYQATRFESMLRGGVLFDGSAGKPVRFLTSISDDVVDFDAVTVSLSNTVSLWKLTLESRGRLTEMSYQGDASIDLPFPGWELTSSLYFRGTLISQTLDLKAGASVSLCGKYVPPVYNPETGMFLLPMTSTADATGVASYTARTVLDLFLFATVKETATIHVILHNLLDARYITTGFYPMNERSFRFGVDWLLFD